MGHSGHAPGLPHVPMPWQGGGQRRTGDSEGGSGSTPVQAGWTWVFGVTGTSLCGEPTVSEPPACVPTLALTGGLSLCSVTSILTSGLPPHSLWPLLPGGFILTL